MYSSLLAILVAATITADPGQDESVKIQQEAQKCATAITKADFEQVVASTHERVVKAAGGKEAMIRLMKRGTEQMSAQGISFENATVGKPAKPEKVGGWLVALVPQHIVMKVPGGQLDHDGHLLAISENGGKTWSFVDTASLTKEHLAAVFPELKDKVEIPARKQPVFTAK